MGEQTGKNGDIEHELDDLTGWKRFWPVEGLKVPVVFFLIILLAFPALRGYIIFLMGSSWAPSESLFFEVVG